MCLLYAATQIRIQYIRYDTVIETSHVSHDGWCIYHVFDEYIVRGYPYPHTIYSFIFECLTTYGVSIMCLTNILYAATHIRIQYIRYDTGVSCVQRIYCMRLQKPCRSVMCLMTYTIRRVMYLSCISRIYCMRLHKPCRIVCWISAARVHI